MNTPKRIPIPITRRDGKPMGARRKPCQCRRCVVARIREADLRREDSE